MPSIPLSDENQATRKLFPTRPLSVRQMAVVEQITHFCQSHLHDSAPALFVLQGAAGTGKSLVLNAAFRGLQRLARNREADCPAWAGTQSIFVVNHPELLKLFREIAGQVPELRKKDFERPTTVINRLSAEARRADVVFIDEAHLLLTRPDRYNHFEQNNQLEELLRLARVVVLAYDECQFLKFKSQWPRAALERFMHAGTCETAELTEQWRIQAQPDLVAWINALAECRIPPPPAPQGYDLRVYASAAALYRDLRERNATAGLSRMLSTYDYPYALDGVDHFIEEGDFRLRWDRSLPQARLPWAERADTIDEVGSVYTIQGFDLNYAGVILGPSMQYDPAIDGIALNPAAYEDQAAFSGRQGVSDPRALQERIMRNALHVLLTRGTRGLYLYAHDPALRQRLLDGAKGAAFAGGTA